MKILLVRHGETDWNVEERIQGWIDVGLNHKGENQAKKTAEKLRNRGPFDLVGSPLRRAKETAEILRSKLYINNCWFLDEFKELNQGHWNGLKGEWLLEREDSHFLKWIKKPTVIEPPGGESLYDVRNRVSKGLESIRSQAQKNVLLVAHKVVNSLVASLLGEWPMEDVMNSLPENASVFELEVNRNDLHFDNHK